MAELTDFEVWPRDTGVTDLPEKLDRLTLPSMSQLRSNWQIRRQEIEGTEALQELSDQLAREWAIETGKIENLYDIERGVTMALIEHGISAALLERGSTNKSPEYVVALIEDQQHALEGLFDFVKKNRPLSIGYIQELHAAMTRSQPTTEALDPNGNWVEIPLLKGKWKEWPNFPVRDGRRFLYCPAEQVQSEMERLIAMHLEHVEKGVPPEAEAAWLHHRFTQIHPFQDGNGRVARALASLVLIRAEMFPFIVPVEEKTEYLDALEAADSGDLRPLVLTIARRQQNALSKATNIIARLTPVENSLDAARVLAKTIGDSPKARSARVQERVARLYKWLHTAIESKIQNANQELSRVDTSARIGHSSSGNYGDLDFISQDPKINLDGRLSNPNTYSMWEGTSPIRWRLRIIVGTLRNDLDERVAGVADFGIADKNIELEIEPIYYGLGSDDNQTVIEADLWADEILKKIFEYLSRMNHQIEP